jgi:hypothetical protein
MQGAEQLQYSCEPGTWTVKLEGDYHSLHSESLQPKSCIVKHIIRFTIWSLAPRSYDL